MGPEQLPREDAGPGPQAEAGALLPPPPVGGGSPHAVTSRSVTRSDRLTAVFEVLLCSGFPTQLLIARVLALAGLTPFTAERQYSAAFIFTLSLVDAVLLVGMVLWFLHRGGESPRAVLLGRRPAIVDVAVGVMLIPVAFMLAIAVLATVQQVAPSLHNVTRNPLEALMRSPGEAALFAVVAVVSGGVREEVQRAFMLHRFDQYLGGGAVGLVVFSVVFGAGHVIQGWDAAIATATLGAFWGAIYLVRRSIAAPLVSHAGFNLAEVIRYTTSGL